MRHYLILFATTHDALQAEKSWPRSGYTGKLRPIPRALSSSCGLCLETDLPDDADPMAILRERALEWEELVEVQGKDLVVNRQRQNSSQP